MSSKTSLLLKDYVFAGYPAIILNTPEEERAIEECFRIAEKASMELYVWSETRGVSIYQNSNGEAIYRETNDIPSPDEEALTKGLEYGDNIIYCLLDFHPYIKAPSVWRTAKDVFSTAKERGIVYVFISNKFEVPSELEHEVIVTNLDLPSKRDLQDIVKELCKTYKISIPTNLNDVVEAALGLTMFEAENAFSTAFSKTRTFDINIISNVKKQILCRDGLLEYMQSKETLETIGGMKEFLRYIQERLSAYSPEAQEYGLPYPKGVLLVGIPGCGKSLAAKALSNIWGKPLLKLDLGKLFGSLVGDTEARTRKALEIAEAMSPAILWIDEVEKGLSGVGSSGKTDSGVTSRMFGTILTWLQEKEAPVYVIATANNISSLPPEFLRKGRFDEIFFVDLPTEEERKEILRIQIGKKKRNPENFDIAKLAISSDGYTGAEIEECVVSAMFYAWNDGNRQFTTEDIEGAMSKIQPMSKGIMSNTVSALREWSSKYGVRNANITYVQSVNTTVSTSNRGKRIMRFTEGEEQ